MSPDERPRLDALWSASTSFAQVDYVLADAFRMRYLRRVLRVGEASSVCRALAFEAAMEAHLHGGWMDRHCVKLLGQVERLARSTGDACDEGWWLLARATRAFTHGQWSEAVAVCERAEVLLRQRCSGVVWELDMLAAYHHGALGMRGELRRLGQRLERYAEDSTRRGDIFGVIESCLATASCRGWRAARAHGPGRSRGRRWRPWSRSSAATWTGTTRPASGVPSARASDSCSPSSTRRFTRAIRGGTGGKSWSASSARTGALRRCASTACRAAMPGPASPWARRSSSRAHP
ncbi:hypothetical protein ACLESO_58375, partial [Pyxidicoccus sp. 3LG]